MLTITPRAAAAIQRLASERGRMGLRIWPEAPHLDGRVLELEAALVNQPEPTDQIIEDQGSQVFVDKRVVRLLANRILDVREPSSRLPSEFRLVAASTRTRSSGGAEN